MWQALSSVSTSGSACSSAYQLTSYMCLVFLFALQASVLEELIILSFVDIYYIHL
jgi:hypothetical protein